MIKAYVALFGGFIIWGVFPLYFYLTRHVGAWETLEWRIVLSVLSLLVICTLRGTLKAVTETFSHPRFMLISTVTALLIGLNWLLYLIAVYHNQTTQASMGYFITPLINVLLGVWLFDERLNKTQTAALFFVAAGVLYQLLVLGIMPWLSLSIGISFGVYGAVRKKCRIPPFAGLLAEMLILSPFALAALLWSFIGGQHFTYSTNHTATVALLFSGIVTAVPLLMFLYGVEHLPLTTVGFAQYISPGLQFCIAVFIFDEPFDLKRLIAFLLIWLGVGLYSINLIQQKRKYT